MGRPKDTLNTDPIIRKQRDYRLQRYYATKQQAQQALAMAHAQQIARVIQINLTPETQARLEQYLLDNFKFKPKPIDNENTL